VTNCPVFPGHVLFSYNNITIFYPYRGGITYFECIEINKVSLSKLRVSFELAHVFTGPSVLVFGKQNMVTLYYLYCMVLLRYLLSRPVSTMMLQRLESI